MPDTLEIPYPIRRLFRRRVIPAMVLASALLAVVSWFGINRLELHIYLETTERRAATTVYLARQLAPIAWEHLLNERDPQAVLRGQEGELLSHVLQGLSDDGRVANLKIFNEGGVTIFSTNERDIGVREENELMKSVLESRAPEIETTRGSGVTLYEIYIPVHDEATGKWVVFEVYEPLSVIDEIISESFLQTTIVPLAIIFLIGVWLDRLTGRAQTDIDRRSQAQQSLRRQLERFVSTSAAGAARMTPEGTVESRRVSMTLYHSDVRDFTSLAEFHPPQETVDFLNRLMTIQVEAVRRHGGDVDKMIGDALLARFEGSDREARALRAAQEVLVTLATSGLPRDVGIGIFDGEAILGAIGPEERQDFTAIGDSVNLAARLCSLARVGEIVVDELALRRSGLAADDFSPVERHKVKGRSGSVMARRWSRPTVAQASEGLASGEATA